MLFDFGSFYYLCNSRDFFLFFDKYEWKIINLLNDEQVKVERICEMNNVFYDGKVGRFIEVRYILGFDRNFVLLERF